MRSIYLAAVIAVTLLASNSLFAQSQSGGGSVISSPPTPLKKDSLSSVDSTLPKIDLGSRTSDSQLTLTRAIPDGSVTAPPSSGGQGAPVLPAPVSGFSLTIGGGYDWTEEGATGQGTCALGAFNPYLSWPASQGNPGDFYTLELHRLTAAVTVIIPRSQVTCTATKCIGSLVGALSDASVQSLTSDFFWNRLIYDHITVNGSGGQEIFPWMAGITAILGSCGAGGCNTSQSTSGNLGIVSMGQYDCDVARGNGYPLPSTARP